MRVLRLRRLVAAGSGSLRECDVSRGLCDSRCYRLRSSYEGTMPTLAETLESVRQKIQRIGSKSINEENTRASLIDPVLRALGWDTEDMEDVQREYKVKPRDKPVDYALLTLRNVRLFIEAKALGGDLDDRRWANQIMGYATVAGVEWIVLTNGAEYRIYNAHAPVAVEEKEFRRVHVKDHRSAVETLELLAKNRLEDNRIEVLWRAHFVDRQVRSAIEDLFSRENNDMLLVNYVAKHTRNLTPEEIRSSIARCRITLDFPVDAAALVGKKTKGKVGQDGQRKKPGQIGVSREDLVAAGLLKPPVALVRRYKGKDLTATLLASGKVRVGNAEYDSLSKAACAALATVIGHERPTNGWDFWQIEERGVLIPIGNLRARLPVSSSGTQRSARRKA